MGLPKRSLALLVLVAVVTGGSAAVLRASRTEPAAAKAEPAAAKAEDAAGTEDPALTAARAQLAELRRALDTKQATPATAVGDHESVTVVGVGRIDADPDVAVASLGVTVQRATVGEAMERANAAARRLIAALKRGGVAARDIRTTSLSVQRDYERKDYIASNVVTAKIRTVARAGDVVGDALEAAGDAARLDGISFDLEQNAALTKAARRDAMTDARAKATEYAGLAGRRLGRVLIVSETGSPSPPPRPAAGFAADGAALQATPIEPGTHTGEVHVLVVYALE